MSFYSVDWDMKHRNSTPTIKCSDVVHATVSGNKVFRSGYSKKNLQLLKYIYLRLCVKEKYPYGFGHNIFSKLLKCKTPRWLRTHFLFVTDFTSFHFCSKRIHLEVFRCKKTFICYDYHFAILDELLRIADIALCLTCFLIVKE